MNICDLCYLDRVSFNGKTIVVTGINGTFNEVTDENNNIYDASVLSPIEVTGEMLVSNGFEDLGNYLRYDFGASRIEWYKSTGVLYFAKDLNVLIPDNIRVKVHYVHELLQLLKKAGLKEMARNFRTN